MRVTADHDVGAGGDELGGQHHLALGRTGRELGAPVEDDHERVDVGSHPRDLRHQRADITRRREPGLGRGRGPRVDKVVVEDLGSPDDGDALPLDGHQVRGVGLRRVPADADDGKARGVSSRERILETLGPEVEAVVVGHRREIDPG